MSRPPHLSAEHASRFKLKSVAELYEFRAPYSTEVFETLLSLMPAEHQIVLDVGCGPGKLARGLAPHVKRVDAVDFSAEMIAAGKAQLGGAHPNIFWQCAPIETAELQLKYGLIVAGASLHWMDWGIVLPKFGKHLDADGHLVILNGDGPANAEWSAERRKLIAKYSTNQDYRPFDLPAELEKRELFKKAGVLQTQSIEDFLKSEHSRESLSIEAMGQDKADEFDDAFKAILEPHVTNGTITYPVSTKITWGKPV